MFLPITGLRGTFKNENLSILPTSHLTVFKNTKKLLTNKSILIPLPPNRVKDIDHFFSANDPFQFVFVITEKCIEELYKVNFLKRYTFAFPRKYMRRNLNVENVFDTTPIHLTDEAGLEIFNAASFFNFLTGKEYARH